MYIVENGLGARVFHSIARMESEVLAIVRGLLSAPDGAGSIFTSGGTESIFQSLLAARQWARETKPQITEPEFVAPHSAHPALNKAAHLLGFSVKRVPVAADYRADVAALAAAIGPNTIGLYASAPTYSLGLVDPIEEIGALAAANDLWLHVDACVGGMLVPAVRRIGYAVPDFDFAVPGVTSISADLHKSGFAAKPASSAHFRTEALKEYARFSFDDWPSGLYSGVTFTGTRPGGAIAAAWAALNYLGESGYDALAASSMRAKEVAVAGLRDIEGMRIHGEPPLWSLSYGHDAIDMHAVAADMNEHGWYCGRTVNPNGIHMMFTPVHEATMPDYLEALRTSIGRVTGGTATGAAGEARYS
ncbi:MAG: aminotransferase class V-fold PLP-dependent enzyme [Chloroflexi bacterium]|nr:aminotransferase class V-fold PLP-dependent enzyme [Chloroflexota bacterium]MDA1148116.1 aminotransferase class V-fold PLP-dependent enzyme [Chloroflexota bacterium]